MLAVYTDIPVPLDAKNNINYYVISNVRFYIWSVGLLVEMSGLEAVQCPCVVLFLGKTLFLHSASILCFTNGYRQYVDTFPDKILGRMSNLHWTSIQGEQQYSKLLTSTEASA